MEAVAWHGNHDARMDEVPDPTIERDTDAIIRVTSTALCGSDLHLYEVLGPFIDAGDILGHEPMGIVEEVGSAVTNIAPGDRVVIPFNISRGQCYMCEKDLQSQCETTQVREYGTGAAFLGYAKLYGQVPGGQSELLRVPMAHYGPQKVPHGTPDDRFLFLSDALRPRDGDRAAALDELDRHVQRTQAVDPGGLEDLLADGVGQHAGHQLRELPFQKKQDGTFKVVLKP